MALEAVYRHFEHAVYILRSESRPLHPWADLFCSVIALLLHLVLGSPSTEALEVAELIWADSLHRYRLPPLSLR